MFDVGKIDRAAYGLFQRDHVVDGGDHGGHVARQEGNRVAAHLCVINRWLEQYIQRDARQARRTECEGHQIAFAMLLRQLVEIGQALERHRQYRRHTQLTCHLHQCRQLVWSHGHSHVNSIVAARSRAAKSPGRRSTHNRHAG